MRIILIHIFLFTVLFAQAQKPKLQNNPDYEKKFFHLGFNLGISQLGYRLNNSQTFMEPVGDKTANDSIFGVEPVSMLSAHIEIITDIRLGEHFNLRCQPGFFLGQRNLEYKRRVPTSRHEFNYTIDVMQLPSYYLELPILFKFKAVRINNYRPYLIAGGAVLYDLEYRRENDENEFYTIQRKPLEFGLQIGVGIDWFMPFFKLGTEFRAHFGFTDILEHEHANEYNTSIESLYTKLFMLSFNFE